MTVFLLLLTAVGVGALGAFAFVARRTDPALSRKATRIALLWAGGYVVLLLGVSILSRPTILESGQRQVFCGVYLDCHLGATVAHVERDSTDEHVRFLVTLRIDSDARHADLRLHAPTAVIVDAGGTVYDRDRATEAVLAQNGSPPRPRTALTQPVSAGDGFTTTLVFTLPPDVERPRLLVREGLGIDRLFESVLVGDDDSLLHAPTYHALTPAPRRPLPLHSTPVSS